MPGAEIQIISESNRYECSFVISTSRIDWNIFDFSTWKIKKATKFKSVYLFYYRKDKKDFEKFYSTNCLSSVLENFNKHCNDVINLGGDVTCVYKNGEVKLKLPNKHWFKHHELDDGLDNLKNWLQTSF